MQSALTLPYAPKRRPRARRTLVKVSVLVLLSVGAWYAYSDVQRRISALEADPSIGPVDWATVLRSPTLLRAAWDLSRGQTRGERWVFAVAPAAPAADMKLKTPIRYEKGRVHFELLITNNGRKPFIVPPYVSSGSVPREVGCFGADVRAWPGPPLGPGVQAMHPGGRAAVTLSAPADRRPANTDVIIQLNEMYLFHISGGGGWASVYPYREWADVPASAVQRSTLGLGGTK